MKPCPFCGGNNCGVRAGTDEIWCVCGGHSPHGWNSRPIENKLQAEIKRLQTRVQELEQERRWIHQDNTMIVKKDGDSWCFVLPTFINLQESKSKWLDPVLSSFIDRVYSNLLPQPPQEEE